MDHEPPSSEHDLLREFLAQRDALCPACGYNLRGLAGPACPECAAPLTLDVARRREGPWPVRVAVVGMAVFTVASAVGAAADLWYWFSPLQHWTVAVTFVGNIAGSALGTVGLVRCWIHRRRAEVARIALLWTGWVMLAWAAWAMAMQLLWLFAF